MPYLRPLARRKPWAGSWLCIATCVLLPLLSGTGRGLAQRVPDGFQAHLAAARQQLSLQHLSLAEQELRVALVLNPAEADAHFLLGNVLFLENRPQDSLAEYTAGARGRPPGVEELMTVASDYILLKDLPDADKWLSYAVKLAPANARAWYLLGRTQYNEDHAADAERSFAQVLALDPRSVRAEYNLGLVDEKLQRQVEALNAYRTAIAWQSGKTVQDAQPYLDLGTLLASQNHAADALPALQDAVRYAPENPLAHQELGRVFESLGRYEEALASLHRAVTLAPESQQPHFFLARVLKRLGRNDEATAEYAIVAKMLGSHSDTPTPNMDGKP